MEFVPNTKTLQVILSKDTLQNYFKKLGEENSGFFF